MYAFTIPSMFLHHVLTASRRQSHSGLIVKMGGQINRFLRSIPLSLD